MAPIEVVPETDKLLTPVIVLPKIASPVIVSELLPPAMVELAVMVVPCRVLVALLPVMVIAPV